MRAVDLASIALFDADRGIAITIEDGKYVGRCEGVNGAVRSSSLEYVQGYLDGLHAAARELGGPPKRRQCQMGIADVEDDDRNWLIGALLSALPAVLVICILLGYIFAGGLF